MKLCIYVDSEEPTTYSGWEYRVGGQMEVAIAGNGTIVCDDVVLTAALTIVLQNLLVALKKGGAK